MRRRSAAVGVLLAVTLLAGCTQDGDGAAGQRVSSEAGAGLDTPPTPDPSAVRAAGLERCPTVAADATPAEDGLPDLTLPCLGAGDDVRISWLRGTPMVVNLWASWCTPCRAELPVLAAAAASYGDRVAFLGVDTIDPNPDGALALLKDSGVRYPSVVDYNKLTQADLRWTGLPMTVLVRADGSVAWRQAGEITSVEQLQGLVREHLGVVP